LSKEGLLLRVSKILAVFSAPYSKRAFAPTTEFFKTEAPFSTAADAVFSIFAASFN